MTTQYKHKVTIVGAGPIGAALALALSQRHPAHSVALIDAALHPPVFDVNTAPDARVFAINPASQQLFASLGIWDTISNARSQPFERMHVRDANGTGSIDFSAEDDASDPYLGYLIEANLIQAVLFDALREAKNVDILSGTTISDVQNGPDHLTIETSDGQRFSTELLCAADGARSSTRTLFKMPVTEKHTGQCAVVANFYHEKDHSNCAWQIFHETGPLAFLPLSDFNCRHLSSMVWSLDQQVSQTVTQMSDAEFVAAVKQATEAHFGEIALASPRFDFELIQRHAVDYVSSHFALVGDAAHSIHPLAGLGANIGYADVAALVRELDRASQRNLSWGDVPILKRYQRARRLENELVLQSMTGFRVLFGTDNPWVASIRNTGLNLVNALSPLKRHIVRQVGALVND